MPGKSTNQPLLFVVMLGCISCLVLTYEHCCVSHDTSYPFIISSVSFSCATPLVIASYCYKCATALFLSGFYTCLHSIHFRGQWLFIGLLYTSNLSLDVDYCIRPNVYCPMAGLTECPVTLFVAVR